MGDNLLLENSTQLLEWSGDGKQLCFFFLKDGQCKFQTEQAAQTLSSGDVLLFSDGPGGKLAPVDKKNFSAVRFLLSFDQLGCLLGLQEISLLERVSGNLSASRYYPASTPLARQCHSMLESVPALPGIAQRSCLLRVAATVLTGEFEAARSEASSQKRRTTGDFASIFNQVSQDDLATLSVEALAKKLGYSRRHLNRLFRDHLGKSVSSMRMEVRLLKSLSLLKNPAAKVIDVALECGFNHLGFFSQCFKRRFGLSPNKWRQQELAKQTIHAQSSSTNALAPFPARLTLNITRGNGSSLQSARNHNGNTTQPGFQTRSRKSTYPESYAGESH